MTPSQRYRLFAGAVLHAYRGDGPDDVGEIDGAALEELAEACGMIERFEVPKNGCGCRCLCVGYADECYRLTRAGAAAVKAAKADGK